MTELNAGDRAPDFRLPLGSGETFSLADAKGRKLVLYFYPKDNTKGCTVEATEFTALADAYEEENTVIVGVSPDSVKSHVKFQEKHDLNIHLGADEDHTVAEAYGVWKEKSMYGKTYMGIERSTFLIDENGEILKIWRKVKAVGHATAVLDTIRQ